MAAGHRAQTIRPACNPVGARPPGGRATEETWWRQVVPVTFHDSRAPPGRSMCLGWVVRWFRCASPPANFLRASGTTWRRGRVRGAAPGENVQTPDTRLKPDTDKRGRQRTLRVGIIPAQQRRPVEESPRAYRNRFLDPTGARFSATSAAADASALHSRAVVSGPLLKRSTRAASLAG